MNNVKRCLLIALRKLLIALSDRTHMTTTNTADEKSEILRLAFPQLLSYVSEMDNPASMPICTGLTQRLYAIALYENHVPKEHRDGALQLLQIVKSTVEDTFEDSPELLAEYS